MSIIITQEPSFLTPSDNPIIYGFGTSLFRPAPNSTLLKYKVSFIVKVFLDVYGEIGVFEVFPEYNDTNSNTAYGKIDVSNIIKSYLKLPDIVPKQYNSNNIFDSGVNVRQLSILVYEKYATSINGDTTLYTSVTSSTCTVFKGCLSHEEFLNFNPYDYSVANFNKKFLTDKPKEELLPGLLSNFLGYTYNFARDDSFHISYLDIDYLNQLNYDKTLRIFYYSPLVGSLDFDIQYPQGDQGVFNSIYINLKSFVDLGYITQAVADSITMITFAVYKTSNNTVVSPVVYLYINKTCFYSGKSLKFLNKFGAYDYFLFEHNERKSASIKSYEYERKGGEWNIYTANFEINKLRDGRNSYLKQTTEKLQLISGYLDEKQQNWLTQLYESPLVYLNYNNGDVKTAIITNTSYTKKQDQYDELYNEIVDVEFTTKNSIEL